MTFSLRTPTGLILALSLGYAACSRHPEPDSGGKTGSATTTATAATSSGASAASDGPTEQKSAADLDPAKATADPPAVFKARFTSSKGSFVIEVHKDWAPEGAKRFYNLVKMGFYNEDRFFRVVPGFMVQFGLNGDPAVSRQWMNATIPDDPVKQSNKRGYVTYGKTGAPNSRTTQIFINFVDGNTRLDGMGFAPFGVVTEGMDVVDAIDKEYGEKPNQGLIQSQGNKYLKSAFPQLDYVKKAEIVQ